MTAGLARRRLGREAGGGRAIDSSIVDPLIAPSLLAADFAHLAAAADSVSNADWLHVDVMDNHFVPNLTIGLPVVRSLLAATSTPLDCHLMIDDPGRWAIGYAEAGAHNVSFHAEACAAPQALARDLQAAGTLAGLAIDRDTDIAPYLPMLGDFDTLVIMTIKAGFGGQDFMPVLLDKVRAVKRARESGHLSLRIEVDGGIGPDTIEAAAEAGADVFVAGSAVFGAQDPGRTVDYLRSLVTDRSA